MVFTWSGKMWKGNTSLATACLYPSEELLTTEEYAISEQLSTTEELSKNSDSSIVNLIIVVKYLKHFIDFDLIYSLDYGTYLDWVYNAILAYSH